MMERRRREAANRVKQRRIPHAIVTEDKPKVVSAPQEPARRTKRDLLARSRRSLSEPHRRFASPPTQRSKNASSPRAMQHQQEEEIGSEPSPKRETTKQPTVVVDQRERRLLLKSKAKQMVSQRAKAASVVPTPVQKQEAEPSQNPMKTLSSPRRIFDRKGNQAKLLSKAKAVVEQRKKPSEKKPESSVVEEFLMEPKPKKSPEKDPTPQKETPTEPVVSFLHKKAAQHKQQRELLRRNKASTSDQNLAEELTAILSNETLSKDTSEPMERVLFDHDHESHDNEAPLHQFASSVDEPAKSLVQSSALSASGDVKGVPEIDSASKSIKGDSSFSTASEGVENTTQPVLMDRILLADQSISEDTLSPSTLQQSVAPCEPTETPLLDPAKRDVMERIRQDETSAPKRLPPPVKTCLIDKTSAIRLDSPEKKSASHQFGVFDLIEIQSTEDEDRTAVSATTAPSVCDMNAERDSPATEAAAIPSYSPACKDGEATRPELGASDSLDEILDTPKEMDFRPLPTAESAIVEASWDANKVLFNEYIKPHQKRSSSWTKEILPKEDSTPLVTAPVQDDDMDPLGWPRSPAGLEGTQQRDFDSQQSVEEETTRQNDEDNLLLVNKSSSDDMDDDYLLASAKSKEERIKDYEAREPDEESSVEEEDSVESDDAEVEIGYVSQESETLDDDLLHDEIDEPKQSMPRMFFPDEIAPAGSEENPIQIPVVLDLSNTDLQPAETLSTDDLDSLLASSEGGGLSPRMLPDPSTDNLVLPPPPPPPKEKKPTKSVPLLAPPSEEKLARWESRSKNNSSQPIKTVVSLFDDEIKESSQQDADDRHVLMQRNQDDVPNKTLKDKKKNRRNSKSVHEDSSSKRTIFPKSGESPFDKIVRHDSVVLKYILDFLGDPVAVCRAKMLSKTCQLFVRRNEHTLMRDAVRLGGMNMNVRPYFWLWVTLEKAGSNNDDGDDDVRSSQLRSLEKAGREGKWSHVIERDVSRAFGNLPPHKSGARLRTDSIVRALVSWGKSRVVKNGVRGTRDVPSGTDGYDSDEISAAPTDTVSDWGGVTPVGSFGGSVDSENEERGPKQNNSRSRKHTPRADEMALSGNTLSEDVKITLQHKLSFVLHALASWNCQVGYCQGMDYIVAHLLRILQDTIRWKAANGTLPAVVENKPTHFGQRPLSRQALQEMYAEVDRSLVVEETCFRVMNTFFTTYSLEHFYWPELRCLKTCCRVFEKLIKIKLPVLHDHFEHHELNVGLFALGWFQTLFLYLPSMPSATVCHMWDIWLVERSFKIFFRVGTAILFLSQPQLLNCELDGMMSYLNTFPDATLLSPDILIACALQIKVTNTMLMELEEEVKRTTMTC